MNSEFRKEKTTPRVGDEPSDHPGVPPRSPRHCPIQRKDEFAAAKRGESPPKKVKVVTVIQFGSMRRREPAQLSGQADRTYE